MRMTSADNFRKISSTALLCAKFRAEYTDMPHVKEIYELAKKESEKGVTDSYIFNAMIKLFLPKKEISMLEGRHLSINDALGKFEDYSILELASGLSPRMLGLESNASYIETDIGSMVPLKKNITNKVSKEYTKNIQELNPLNSLDLISFGEKFPKNKEINVVNEGLLMYFSDTEQKNLRDNIRLFLSSYSKNGNWITTDFSSRNFKKKNNLVNFVMNKIEKSTSRKFNRFESDEEVYEFLKEGGLSGEPVENNNIVDKLSCLNKINLSLEDAKSVASLYRAWNIKLE